jgi:hypothetical protein
MWECTFRCKSGLKSGLINVLRARDFFANTNLNPRDALFGGRTSPAIMYYEFTHEEKGRNYDFISLYPSVQNKYCYPTKHAQIIRGVEECSDIEVSS